MKHPNMQRSRIRGGAAALGAAFFALLAGAAAQAQIDATNWGRVTAPVFGTTDPTYTDAELTPGPNKFADGNYFHGVLPNGKKVLPAGTSVQIGMNPLGSALTPDGKYLITTNDDERENYFPDLDVSAHADPGSIVAHSAYSLSVIDTATMKVVSQIDTAGKFFIGLQVTGSGPYTVYASGGPENNVKVLSVAADGTISAPSTVIPILPITPVGQGFVSNYSVTSGFDATKVPSPGSSTNHAVFTAGAKITFPAGSALSPDGKFLYVACNGDNSLAVISTATNTVVKQVPVGYFPYGVSVSHDGKRILVSNWGVTAYKFLPTGTPGSTGSLTYDGSNTLASLARISPGSDPGALDSLFFVPVTSADGANPKTSSVSVLIAPGGDGSLVTPLGSIYQGQTLDNEYQVGDTHPSATAIVRHGALEVLYVAKANDDSLGLVLTSNNRKLADFDLSPLHLTLLDGHKVHGSYPNALAVSPDNTRLYVAEADLNSVAVLDVSNPTAPKLLGRIPTGWYPTSVVVSPDGQSLYVTNAKGIGEDINPKTGIIVNFPSPSTATLPGQFSGGVDSNYLYGSAQKINLNGLKLDNTTVASYDYAVQPANKLDTSIVPLGSSASTKIKHVIFILHENKTFDSVLGNQKGHFGDFAGTSFFYKDGTPYNVAGPVPYTSGQYTGVSLNEQLLATTFAAGVNYYSDSEESDAGHQFAASGTASDYTEKTILVKSGRGLLVNKNFEPEDYPEGGYIFNNAARNGVSFKDYGAMVRIDGTDTGSSLPTTTDDPLSGNLGYPTVSDGFHVDKDPAGKVISAGDVNTQTQGLGQSYFLALPILDILGTENGTGEPRLDRNYPGYNFNISDQRRAKEFIKDFDAMVAGGTLPQFLYIYEPNDHTGGVQAPNASAVVTDLPAQEVADGDVGLGMVVDHIMKSTAYYNPSDGTGAAIFVTWDDAQSTLDHIHPHRTPLLVISPYAKKGYVAKKHYVTASIVKTEELLLGLPPNNYGDLFATDLRDMFTDTYNGITEADLAPKFTRNARYQGSPEGKHIWTLVAKLDSSAPDRDSARLGALARLSMAADDLHQAAVRKSHLHTAQYQATQARLYQAALKLVSGPAAHDTDD